MITVVQTPRSACLMATLYYSSSKIFSWPQDDQGNTVVHHKHSTLCIRTDTLLTHMMPEKDKELGTCLSLLNYVHQSF